MSPNKSTEWVELCNRFELISTYNLDNAFIYALPTLDIEELLYKKPWKGEGLLTTDQQTALDEAKKFLEKALEGKRIVDQLRKGKVIMDLDSVEAYHLSCRALKTEEKTIDVGFEEFVGVIQSTLDNITVADEKNIRIVHEFFLALTKLSTYN